MQAARLALLLLLASALQMFWIVEQPVGSSLWMYPRLQQVLQSVTVFRHSFCMIDFGHDSLKPTWLWSNRDIIREVDQWKIRRSERNPRVPLVDAHIDSSGRRIFHGNGNTKASQAYPEAFGHAIAKVYRTHDVMLKSVASSWFGQVYDHAAQNSFETIAALMGMDVPQLRGWEDAQLDQVFEYIRPRV